MNMLGKIMKSKTFSIVEQRQVDFGNECWMAAFLSRPSSNSMFSAWPWLILLILIFNCNQILSMCKHLPTFSPPYHCLLPTVISSLCIKQCVLELIFKNGYMCICVFVCMVLYKIKMAASFPKQSTYFWS